jgi:RNA polymerase sigma-70 factor (ECF subfamily)
MTIKEPEEIAEIYLSKKKILLNIAFTYLRDEEQAVNLVANVIVTMLEKERTFPNEETCLAYMKQIVRNGAKNILRKNEEMLLWEGMDIEALKNEIEQNNSPYGKIEVKMCLRSLIKDYPYSIREAFVLHLLDGVPSRILARELGIKHDTLRRQFSRIKKRLLEISPTIKKDLLLLLMSHL